ncbi:MAG: ROK family protein [Ignavibacteria bacterium]|nr:ROK family protein [Ignavibacteria bacterium]
MKNRKNIIGIDIGGTSIKFGIVTVEGKLLSHFSLPSYANESPKRVISQLKIGIRQLLDGKSLKDFLGIGIGTPGKVDTKTGNVSCLPNFKDWNVINLQKVLGKSFPTKIRVDNDANAAALGELHYGAGKKTKNFILVTLGTGVGGGIIIDSKLVHGETGGAGEIGHISIDYDGPLCNCGQRGCVEAYVGNHYIKQRTIQQLNEYSDSMILELVNGNLDLIDPKIISIASKKGDYLATKIIVDTGFYLGIALASAVNLLDIKTIIIGGGVSASGRKLFESIEKSVKMHGVKSIVDKVKVVPAKLKNNAGILGAATLVKE